MNVSCQSVQFFRIGAISNALSTRSDLDLNLVQELGLETFTAEFLKHLSSRWWYWPLIEKKLVSKSLNETGLFFVFYNRISVILPFCYWATFLYLHCIFLDAFPIHNILWKLTTWFWLLAQYFLVWFCSFRCCLDSENCFSENRYQHKYQQSFYPSHCGTSKKKLVD